MITFFSPADEAERLGASWINGNRGDVLDELASCSPITAAAVAAYMARYLNEEDVWVFLGMLESRAVEEFRARTPP